VFGRAGRPTRTELSNLFIRASRITAAIQSHIEAQLRLLAAKWLADLQHLTKLASDFRGEKNLAEFIEKLPQQ
jgi:hypothetical protein